MVVLVVEVVVAVVLENPGNYEKTKNANLSNIFPWCLGGPWGTLGGPWENVRKK